MQSTNLKRLIFWCLPVILLVWWRGHTFGPIVLEKTGLQFWPVVEGRSEPLDCDESAYGYMGRRQIEGKALYKDLTEYKPPVGYWYYAIGVGIGGASELTIRLMILPVLIANLCLIGSILKCSGKPAGAFAGMMVFVLLSTDPYVYANGSNLEHLMNLGLTAAIYAVLRTEKSGQGGLWLVISGVFLGLSAAVKQVCILGMIPLVIHVLVKNGPIAIKGRKILQLSAGFAIPWLIAGLILGFQGALADAWQDVVQYSQTMAANTPPDANAPPWFYRWLTGNADPRNGRLPWPFGRTDWLVWWGTGSWPIGIATVFNLLISLKYHRNAIGSIRTLVATMWLACWGMIVLPGLYWQHYYMLLGPGGALLSGFFMSGLMDSLQSAGRWTKKIGLSLALGLYLLAISMTFAIQVQDYLMVPAEQLTIRYKGGAQWVSLRLLSEDIARRVESWSPRPRLEMWGWQSPILYYANLDAPSPYFFTDPLMKVLALKDDALIRQRLERLTVDLEASRPELVFCGDAPFPRLKALLDRDYLASSMVPSAPDGRGFFVRRDLYQKFHSPEFQKNIVK
ncbi:MAG: glycosyltransferase family 39 protein [Planctomycetota bacterium]